MRRSILTYGIISGLIIIVSIMISVITGHGHVWLGYLIMVVAFSSIFVAIKQYRNETQGGVIRFSTASLLGLGISLVAGIVYVGIWEVYLAVTDYQPMDDYANSIIESKRLAGASDKELLQATADARQLKEQYANPFFRLPMTFLEVFPVGVLVSLASAAILSNQRKNRSQNG